MIFLSDNHRQYSYEDLILSVCKDSYCPMLKTSDLFHFFANMITALVSGESLLLLDSDLNLSEIPNIDERRINCQVGIEPISFSNIEELIAAVQSSKSRITIFTSGTTGQPKEVVHTIGTITRAVRTGNHYAGQTWAFAYNPTHMAGLQVFFQVLYNQGTMVNVFNHNRSDIYNQIERWKITHISATPTFYRLLLPFEKEFPSVKRVTLGGEMSSAELYDKICQIFPNAKINNIYASTEAGTLFSAKGEAFHIPDDIADKIKVIDQELLIHRNLLGQSESLVFDNDYYHTGDLIEWVDQESGLFRFKSRKNELINVGGYKVNPTEVEKAILSIAGVCQARVFGKANSVLGNVLCADIQISPKTTLTEFDVRQQLSQLLQDYKIPRRIKFVEKISLTRTGKINRN